MSFRSPLDQVPGGRCGASSAVNAWHRQSGNWRSLRRCRTSIFRKCRILAHTLLPPGERTGWRRLAADTTPPVALSAGWSAGMVRPGNGSRASFRPAVALPPATRRWMTARPATCCTTPTTRPRTAADASTAIDPGHRRGGESSRPIPTRLVDWAPTPPPIQSLGSSCKPTAFPAAHRHPPPRPSIAAPAHEHRRGKANRNPFASQPITKGKPSLEPSG